MIALLEEIELTVMNHTANPAHTSQGWPPLPDVSEIGSTWVSESTSRALRRSLQAALDT
jgi:hypothetical protein